MDLENLPKTFSKLIRERKKLHDPRMIKYEDKLQAMQFVAKCGVLVPELYFTRRDPRNIPFEKLPNCYVIKPNHLACAHGVMLMNRGTNIADGKTYDADEIVGIMEQMLQRRHYPEEWAVYNIEPMLIVEEMVTNENGIRGEICNDYRCYVFGGEVEMISFSTACHHFIVNKSKPVELAFYDQNWNRMRIVTGNSQEVLNDVPAPVGLGKMVENAKKLGSCIDFVRVDFYITPSGPVFGEFSLYPYGGKMPITHEADEYLGRLYTRVQNR